MTDEKGVPAKFFHEVYREGRPPWETGRPQPEVVRMADAGLFRGRLLDVGCGTGENALLLAERGCDVLGVDAVPWAIDEAKRKAAGRNLPVRFEVHDALELETLGAAPFDGVLDSGLFHVFSDADRPRFLAGLKAATKPGGRFVLLCFRDDERSEIGPRRIARAELEACFTEGWTCERIEPARYESTAHPGGAKAWLAVFRRV